jgi:hypothetical protein
MKHIYAQHGDLVLELVSSIPEGAKKLAFCEGFILERGEGIHVHVLKIAENYGCGIQESPIQLKQVKDDVEIYSINDTMYIKVKKDKTVILDHEEHGKQILKEGIYKKHIEREYNYEQNEERRVID